MTLGYFPGGRTARQNLGLEIKNLILALECVETLECSIYVIGTSMHAFPIHRESVVYRLSITKKYILWHYTLDTV